MQYSEQSWSRKGVETLMDMSAMLTEMTGSIEQAREIPVYLSRVLDLDSLTLAIVRETSDEPSLFLTSSSGQVARSEADETFQTQILSIFRQTRPLSPSEGPRLRHPFDDSGSPALSEMAVQRLAAFPRATVLARTLDERHRMLLIVHQGADEAHLSVEITDMLELAATQMAKLLTCLVTWHARPTELGEPFNRLTEREWMVLRGLNSDAGEKQLADQLGLSPHTLHSHIKSIYRKMSVQGRLPLLMKIQTALRTLRTEQLNPTITVEVLEAGNKPAVAIG